MNVKASQTHKITVLMEIHKYNIYIKGLIHNVWHNREFP